MTVTEARAELEERQVYLVTTTDHMSLIGEYAGVDERGRLVFVPGPLAPLHVPPAKVVDFVRLS